MSAYTPYTYKGYPHGLKYPWTYPMVSEKERDRRWANLRKSMEKHKLDCLIIPGNNGNYLVNSRYLSYISNYIPFFGDAFVVFPIDKEPSLSVPSAIGPQFIHCATESSWITNITGSLRQADDIVNRIRQLKLDKGTIGVVGYEEMLFSASVYNSITKELPDIILRHATDAIIEIMKTSSDEELAMVRKCAAICDLSYEAVVQEMRPGVKEYELWAAAENAILRAGAIYPHFMLATSGSRPLFPRGPPSHNVLSPGDVAIFEINAVYGDSSTQICYAVSLGPPEEEIGKMFDFCSELYQFTIQELEAKSTYGDIEKELVRRIQESGYEPMTPQVHIFGKSVGMPYGEKPKPGDYFTVHPNLVDKDYTRGAKFGDTVLINKEGKVEHLMNTPRRLNVVPI